MNTIKEGDVITCIRPGYHLVTKITQRWKNIQLGNHGYAHPYDVVGSFDPLKCGQELDPIVSCRRIFTADGKPSKGKSIQNYSLCHCRLAVDTIKTTIVRYQEMLQTIKDMK